MKLRRLTHKSSVKEGMSYLQKRHPLYFINHKLNKTQIEDLIQRLIYRLKQNHEMKGSHEKENDEP